MKVQVCSWKTCKERFSEYIITRLENDKIRDGLDHLIIEEAKCMGHCKMWPNVKIDGNVEHNMGPAKVSEIIHKKLKK